MNYYSSASIFETDPNLTVRQHVSLDDEGYQFDERIVAKHKDGRWFTARSSGCSCPVPFEEFTRLEELEQIGLRASYRDPTETDGYVFHHFKAAEKLGDRETMKRYRVRVRTSWDELIEEAEAVLAWTRGTATDRFYGTPPEESTIAHYVTWLKCQRTEVRKARKRVSWHDRWAFPKP